MAKTVLNLLMTFDGFIAGPHDEIDWIEKNYGKASDTSVIKEEVFNFSAFTKNVGAIVIGFRSYLLGVEKGWFKDNAYGSSPIFVVCKEIPGTISIDADFRFVTQGVEVAHKEATQAAGDRWVYLFGGASIFQQALESNLVDKLRITIAPVLIGAGIRLFDHLRERRTGLDRIKCNAHSNGMVEVHYRIIR
jgi:dihydrofolate reductase